MRSKTYFTNSTAYRDVQPSTKRPVRRIYQRQVPSVRRRYPLRPHTKHMLRLHPNYIESGFLTEPSGWNHVFRRFQSSELEAFWLSHRPRNSNVRVYARNKYTDRMSRLLQVVVPPGTTLYDQPAYHPFERASHFLPVMGKKPFVHGCLNAAPPLRTT